MSKLFPNFKDANSYAKQLPNKKNIKLVREGDNWMVIDKTPVITPQVVKSDRPPAKRMSLPGENTKVTNINKTNTNPTFVSNVFKSDHSPAKWTALPVKNTKAANINKTNTSPTFVSNWFINNDGIGGSRDAVKRMRAQDRSDMRKRGK